MWLAALFVVMVSYLLSVIRWVEHSDRVISNANEAVRLTVDLETELLNSPGILPTRPDRVAEIVLELAWRSGKLEIGRAHV